MHGLTIKVLRIPGRASQANTHAERWVGTVRRELLDRMLILGRRQLGPVLAEYADHDTLHRPHRALGRPHRSGPSTHRFPLPRAFGAGTRLGGLVHEYHQVAA